MCIGAYVANTVTAKLTPMVRSVDTDKNRFIKNVPIRADSLNQCNIVHIKYDLNNNNEKLKRIIKNFPKLANKKLKTLCSLNTLTFSH